MLVVVHSVSLDLGDNGANCFALWAVARPASERGVWLVRSQAVLARRHQIVVAVDGLADEVGVGFGLFNGYFVGQCKYMRPTVALLLIFTGDNEVTANVANILVKNLVCTPRYRRVFRGVHFSIPPV